MDRRSFLKVSIASLGALIGARLAALVKAEDVVEPVFTVPSGIPCAIGMEDPSYWPKRVLLPKRVYLPLVSK